MTGYLKVFLIAIASGAIGLVTGTIAKRSIEVDKKQRGPFNVHGWYVTGILSFLLICAVASDWGSIPELATILSFAVGLASLILSLIAIIQSLTSNNHVEAALASIRQAAEGAFEAGNQLAGNVANIGQVAEQAMAAAASAQKSTQNFELLSSALVESSESGRAAVNALREEVKQNLVPASTKQNPENQTGKKNVFVNSVTLGGAAIAYAAIRAAELDRPFEIAKLTPDNSMDSYEDGYLSALDDIGLLTIKRSGEIIQIVRIRPELADTANYLRNKFFRNPLTLAQHKARIEAVDTYFSDIGNSNEIEPPDD